jgi:hypothetical protein
VGKCYNSITIPAPASEVWAALRNFHEMSWAKGVITSCVAVGDTPADQVGARRVLNDAFHETLRSIDEVALRFTYTIDDGPGPVSKEAVRNYVGDVRVAPITENNTSFVEWQSSYESADESAVGEFCNPIYSAFLAALKTSFS